MADITRVPGAGTPIPDPTRVTAPSTSRPPAGPAGAGTRQSFDEILRARQAAEAAPPAALRFSAHAQTRMQSRSITLDPSRMDRLQGAVQKAAGKGSRDALVLMDDLAMVVSVTNRTVVTVVDKENLKQNVFTNIDSAVIA